jgi:mannose-6-phosphate isomerase-like protein (cupin superfamily)
MGLQNTRRRAPQVSPRDIKKHSDIVREVGAKLIIEGTKIPTETGYIIPGHAGVRLETYFERFLPGASGPLVCHDKKDRVVRVLAGAGFLVCNDDTKRLQQGDEVILPANSTYRFSATSNTELDLHIAQESKYTFALRVVEEAGSKVEPTSEQLLSDSNSSGDVILHTRTGSKAKQQLSRQRDQARPGEKASAPLPSMHHVANVRAVTPTEHD